MERSPRADPVVWLVLAGGLVISALVMGWLSGVEQRNESARFDRRILAHRAAVASELATGVDAATALAALYAASNTVTAEEFETFGRALLSSRPQVRAVEWAPKVEPEQREAHLAEARAAGLSDYRIWTLEDGRGAGSSVAWPVRLVVPLAPNRAALGLDLASCPIRRRAVERALETDGPWVSEPVVLVQGPGTQPDGMLVIQAIRREGQELGVVLVVLDVAQTLARVDPALRGDDIKAWLLHSGSSLVVLAQTDVPAEPPSELDPQVRRELLELPGLELELRYARGAAAEPGSPVPWTFGLTGVLMSLLVSRAVHEERRRAHEETRNVLASARAQAAMLRGQRLESLGLLAGGVAHDFNNLLTSILGNTELLLHAVPPDSRPGTHAAQIEIAARRATELVRQLLTYAGRGGSRRESVNVSRLVEEMSRLLESSVGKSARLEVELAPQLPLVSVDATQLRQVVMNLITNAVDALGDQAGWIRVRTESADEAPRLEHGAWVLEPPKSSPLVVLTVSDSGLGMDEATQERMFEPFFSTREGGHGLGLAAVLGVVRESGAGLHVQSTPGEGTVIRVVLPTTTAGPAADASPPAPSRDGLAGVRLLLVDDEESIRNLARRILVGAACDVEEAGSGREAVERIRADPGAFDVALLDLTMPEMDGLSALAAMRALRADLPVVLCSGYSSERVDHLTDERTGFLPKPYRAEELLAAVRARVG